MIVINEIGEAESFSGRVLKMMVSTQGILTTLNNVNFSKSNWKKNYFLKVSAGTKKKGEIRNADISPREPRDSSQKSHCHLCSKRIPLRITKFLQLELMMKLL